MLKIASWNVNSLNKRCDHVLTWLEATQVDILALQETKLIDEKFPTERFLSKGYHIIFSGQKSYNGVAIISRSAISDTLTDIPNLDDPQRRILVATIGNIRLINLYVPNGASVNSEKYYYKLAWMKEIKNFLKQQLALYPNLAVVGDFNVAPDDSDVHNPAEWEGSVLVSPLERQLFNSWINLGLKDSFRLFPQEKSLYSWWDYRAASFRRNRGVRIDHILLSNPLAEKCLTSAIDKAPRAWECPSDHTPVWVELSL